MLCSVCLALGVYYIKIIEIDIDIYYIYIVRLTDDSIVYHTHSISLAYVVSLTVVLYSQ